jgi:hypothetical protein
MGKSRRIHNSRKSRVGPSPAKNKYRRNEPCRKGKRKSKGGAKEEQKKVTIKIWDDQGVEKYRRKLEKAIFKDQEVEKMAVELTQGIEKATTKKEVIVNGAKGTRKKYEW